MRSAVLAIAGFAGLAVLCVAACQSSDVSRSIGARCRSASECDDRCLPPGNDYPGGFCTIACESRAECPSATTCADREGGVCLYECTTDESCTFLGTGWRCGSANLRGGGIQVMVCRGT